MKKQDLNSLLERYFRGQLADSEYELLTELLKDKENMATFETAKHAWEQQPDLDETGTRNLNRLNYQLSKTSVVTRKPLVVRFWFQVTAAAAILVL